MDACLDDEQVLALLEGRLEGAGLAGIDEHVDRCASCRAVVLGSARSFAGGHEASARIGRYEVIGELGRGSFGVVMLARDPELERRVALKLLHEDDATWKARLQEEARAMARLSHPHVVTVYEVGQHEGRIFLAMEHVEGPTLRTWLASEARPLRVILEAFAQAGEGLAAAHAAGLVHGDFKPDNVLVGADGRARVTDFGLAQPTDELAVASARLVGTPAYMAPEQLAGRPADALSDQYAFCVALYEAVTTGRPFRAPDLPTLIAEAPARKLGPRHPRMPRSLHEVVARGLRAEPGARFASMPALLAALRRGAAQSRRIGAAALVGLGLVAIAIGVAARPSPCSAGAHLAEETYGEGRRDAIRAAFEATAPRIAAGSLRIVDQSLGAWRERWAASYRSVCLAARDQASSADAGRSACLMRQRREVEALVDALAAPSATSALHAADAVAALPDPRACEALVTAEPSPAQSAHLAGFDEGLAEGKAALATGHYERAERRARDLVAQADAADHDRSRAEAQLLLGAAALKRADYQAADSATLEAIWAAGRAAEDRLAAEAWLQRAAIAGTRDRNEQAEEACHHAAALLARLEAPELEARLHNALGTLYTNLGRFDEAEHELAQSLRQRIALYGEHHVAVSRSHTNLGNLARSRGDLAKAAHHHEAARAIDRALLGEDHPNEARHQHNLARIALLSGETKRAEALYLAALELERAHLGGDHPEVGITLNSLGLLYASKGEIDRARDHFRGAIERLDGRRPRAAAQARENLARLDRDEPGTPPPVPSDPAPKPPAPLAPKTTPAAAPATKGAPAPSPEPAPPPAPEPASPKPPTNPPKPAPPRPKPPRPSAGPPGSYSPGQAWD